MSASTIIIIGLIAFIAGFVAGFYVNKFIKSSKEDQIDTIKNILLYLVAMAEKELGSGTGKLKLAKVYDEFTANYPELAKTITYDEFAKLVDVVLNEFQDILKNNDSINKYITESTAKEEVKE